MKTSAILCSLLASIALAQPHGHGHNHAHKRDIHVEWTTEVVTVTEYVDDTTTVTSTSSPSLPTKVVEETEKTSPTAAFIESKTTSKEPEYTPETTTSTPEPPPPPPETTTTPQVVAQELPTTTKKAPPPPTAVAPPSGGGGGGSHTGDVTYFQIGLGACGENYSGQDESVNIVALAASFMGAESNGNSFCGRTITIKGPKGTTTAVVQDKCPECDPDAIDVSKKTFLELFGSLDVGRGKCTWSFN